MRVPVSTRRPAARWMKERRLRKQRLATLDAYWSHEITAQEAARRLAGTR